MTTMSRPNFIHQVHIADGFADDCEELIHRWLKTDSLTYETFCEIWKDMQFGYIYYGRTSGAELAELSEEVIHIAKHYMTANTSNIEESVAGVFLVYGLLNLQPFPGFAALRVCPEDVPALNRIEMVARKQKRYDVLYTLGSVLTEGPVQYQAAEREYGMESGIRKYLEGFTGIDRLGVRPKGVFYRQTEELDIIRELGSISRRYSDAKRALGGKNSRNLSFADEGFAKDLDTSLKKIINGIIEDNEEADEKIENHYNTVQAVKEKAMRQKVDGVRFLQTADPTKKPPVKRGQKSKCEIKSKPGKVRQGSPKKPVTSFAKRKAGGLIAPKVKRRRISQLKIDLAPNSGERHYCEHTIDSDNSSGASNDFVLDNFDKDKNDDVTTSATEDLHISIAAVPVLIRAEDEGETFEIQLLDKDAEAALPTKEQPENTETKLKKLREVSLVKIKHGSIVITPEQSTEMAQIFKVDDGIKLIDENPEAPKLRKLEQSELKRSSLKSRFKKQGMLKVANFNESAENTTNDVENVRVLRSRTRSK